MKEPQHPVSPAFYRALDKDEAWRHRQIVALTPEQRERYDALNARHEKMLDATRQEFAKGERARTAQIMRRELSKPPGPSLKPRGAGSGLAPDDHLRNEAAISDYLDGKRTPATRGREARLFHAEKTAVHELHLAHDTAVKPVMDRAREEKDQFLHHCAKERSRDTRKNEAREGFARAANNDNAHRRAFNKATRQQEERERSDPDLTKTFDRAR